MDYLLQSGLSTDNDCISICLLIKCPNIRNCTNILSTKILTPIRQELPVNGDVLTSMLL